MATNRDYDFFQELDKRYERLYSYGGKVETSFWQNVGKIVNKKESIERNKTFDEIYGKADEILRGKKWQKQNLMN